jgi:plasmid stabilization system protein ParE
MSYRFHPEAEAELNLSIDYYESIEPGLGYDFALEVYGTIQRILDFPRAWTILEGDIRRSLVRRFPYGLLYSEEADGILILAVMNLHRSPDYWKHRV